MTEREQYEAWFRDFYKQEPMPELGAPAHDFCWAGYRAGAASRDAEVARLKTVPMRYRRMAFNAQLQDEVTRLEQENDQLRTQIKQKDAEIAELVAALEWVRKVTVDIEMHDAIDFALAKVRKP